MASNKIGLYTNLQSGSPFPSEKFKGEAREREKSLCTSLLTAAILKITSEMIQDRKSHFLSLPTNQKKVQILDFLHAIWQVVVSGPPPSQGKECPDRRLPLHTSDKTQESNYLSIFWFIISTGWNLAYSQATFLNLSPGIYNHRFLDIATSMNHVLQREMNCYQNTLAAL